MFTLQGRQDAFRLLLPKEFICPEIEEKYTNIVKKQNSFIHSPIEFLNETIQRVEILGFDNATFQQSQSSTGYPIINENRINQNKFMFPADEVTYRSEVSPIALIDKTLNITFRHTLGFVNYFLLLENFFYQYSRDRKYSELDYNFNIDIFNETGAIYSRVVIMKPIIHSMDMLSFDFTQLEGVSQTFNVSFKYTNFDYQFIDIVDNNRYYIEPDILIAQDNDYFKGD